MKGEVRTIDMHVGFVAQFAEKVSKADVTPRLGFALSAFYSSKDKTDWSGTLRRRRSQRTHPRRTGGRLPVEGCEIVLDQGTWRIKEVNTSARFASDL